jgi:16S rRNA G966 N2-methylase RsmD
MATEKNKLYYGDNLEVLKRYVKDETVDLVYLDPPFNSRQDYNVLFAEKDGSQSSSNTQLACPTSQNPSAFSVAEAKGFS